MAGGCFEEPDTEQDGKAQFAAGYDIDMGELDNAREFFGDGSDSE